MLKILSTYFLGRPNWFSELSQINVKTLYWPTFRRRRQIVQKAGQKGVFMQFWKISTKKIRPKIDISKQYKGQITKSATGANIDYAEKKQKNGI